MPRTVQRKTRKPEWLTLSSFVLVLISLSRTSHAFYMYSSLKSLPFTALPTCSRLFKRSAELTFSRRQTRRLGARRRSWRAVAAPIIPPPIIATSHTISRVLHTLSTETRARKQRGKGSLSSEMERKNAKEG